jgi:hypothetical protein
MTNSTLYGMANIRLHAGFRSLRGTGRAYREGARRWHDSITDDFLSWTRRQVPPTWAPKQAIDELFAFLADRAAIADQQSRELQELTL